MPNNVKQQVRWQVDLPSVEWQVDQQARQQVDRQVWRQIGHQVGWLVRQRVWWSVYRENRAQQR